jgi:cysteinyl-tRNA synthetase
VARPDIAPHATDHVADMIAMTARLIATGNAYEAEGHVLFHVPSDPDYGALGRRDRDATVAGARVEIAAYKKDPADFVLWKPSPGDMIGWDSPWGRGRPGWHIECSAMIERHLGETIDIHAGGLDLIFPHHENELAQSRCAHGGAPLARYWLHNGFLSMAGSEKMSKSLGNVVTVGDLLEAGWSGDVLRLALLSAHYRQPLEWSDQLLIRSQQKVDRYYRVLGLRDERPAPVPDYVLRPLNDDLNTPLALQVLDRRVHAVFQSWEEVAKCSSRGDEKGYQENLELTRATAANVAGIGYLLGLGLEPEDYFGRSADPKVDALVAARAAAKKARNFAEADRIRAELASEGVVLEDTPTGTTWRRA